MTQARKFAGDVGVRIGFQFLNALKGLAFLPLVSRQFGAEGYAIWSQIVITVILLTPIANLRLNDAIVRYLGGREERNRTITATFLAAITASAFVLAAGWLLRVPLATAVFADQSLSSFAVLMIGLLLARSNSQWIMSYFRAVSAIRLYTALQILQIVGELAVLVIVPRFVSHALETSIQGVILVDAAIAVISLALIVRREGIAFSPDWKSLRQFVRYSLPLIATTGLYWVVNSFDRYVIVHSRGLEELAVYSAAYQVSQTLKLIVQPLSFVLLPMISRMWDRGESKAALEWMSMSLDAYLIIAFPAAVGLVILGPALVKLLGGVSLVASRVLFLWLVAGIFIVGLYQIYVYLIYLHERTSRLLILFGVTAAFNASLNLLLVPRMGLVGAAITTLLSYLLQFMLLRLLQRGLSSITVNWARAIKVVISSTVMGAAILLISRLTSAGTIVLVGVGGIIYFFVLIGIGGIGMQELRKVAGLRKRG